MRVALTVYNANFLGGGNKFTAALATSLSGAGFDVALCAGNKPIRGRCHKEFLEARRLYTASPLKPTRRAKLYSSSLLVAVALKRCIRRFNPDVVINADSPPAVFSLIGKGKTKFVQYVHWPTELQAYRHSMLLELYRAFYWGLHYRSLKRLDAAVCNSNFTQGMARIMWRAELPADRFHVIYPAADVNKFQRSYVDRKKKICYVGRLDGNKGIDMVIDAFLKVHENHPDLELEIAGAVNPGDIYTTAYYPRLRNRLFRLAKREITLRLNPTDDEIVNVYKSSRIFANYNPGEHFGICVPPWTLISTGGTIRRIDELKVGDLVQTHVGQKKRVTRIYRRPYHGKLVRIKPSNLGTEALLTPEHPVLAITRYGKEKFATCVKRMARWVRALDLKKGDILLYPLTREEEDVEFLDVSNYLDFEWKNYYGKGPTGKDGFIFYTYGHADNERHKIPQRLKLTNEIFRLFGYYVAVGYVTAKGNAVAFSFNAKDRDYVDDVKRLMKKYFREKIACERVRNGGCEITYSSRILATLMTGMFGSGARQKHLPEWMLSLPKPKQLQLIVGMLRDNGCMTRSKLGYGSIDYKTNSRILTHQIKEILLRLGFMPSIVENKKGCSYDIHVYGQRTGALTKIVWRSRPRLARHLRRRSQIRGDYAYLPIARVSREFYSGDVMNLEVEDDNSYLLEGVAVHNCVVESQAAGAVPIVAHGGGQVETVANGETGFLVNSSEEMVDRMELLLSDDLTFKRMSQKAMERAKLFSNETFTEKWINLIQEITI